jgi:hypothetical protein
MLALKVNLIALKRWNLRLEILLLEGISKNSLPSLLHLVLEKANYQKTKRLMSVTMILPKLRINLSVRETFLRENITTQMLILSLTKMLMQRLDLLVATST